MDPSQKRFEPFFYLVIPNDIFNKTLVSFGEGLASYRNTGARPTKERYKMNFSCNLFLFQALH